MVVQCKLLGPNGRVTPAIVNQIRGAGILHGATRFVVVTNSGASTRALQLAQNIGVEIVFGEKFERWLRGEAAIKAKSQT